MVISKVREGSAGVQTHYKVKRDGKYLNATCDYWGKVGVTHKTQADAIKALIKADCRATSGRTHPHYGLRDLGFYFETDGAVIVSQHVYIIEEECPIDLEQVKLKGE